MVPAHGRLELSRICLRQLRRTCDALADYDIEATAVVIACDENLDTARELGFATIERDNRFLSRRFNDGIQLALDKQYNRHPARYVVPCGSDDWVAPEIFQDLPSNSKIVGFQHISFVREDGRELTTRFLNYPGGCGIRVYPRFMLEPLGFRPADEDRSRGCDTSILMNVSRLTGRLRSIVHKTIDPYCIVDWKTAGNNVTPYQTVAGRHKAITSADPFEALADYFPQDSLDEMAAHYGRTRELVAA